MSFTGHVMNGQVVLDAPLPLADGTTIEVAVQKPEPVPENGTVQIPTLYERYKDFIGSCPELPEDMAENQDHYIHGTPKR